MIVLTSVLLATAVAWSDALLEKKVLIIGIDGTMPSALAVANTPVIDGLKIEGAFSDRVITHPVTATVDKLTSDDPDVFYTILLDVDSAGHSSGWGPGVANYVSAIETADGRVGQIMAALTGRATYAPRGLAGDPVDGPWQAR